MRPAAKTAAKHAARLLVALGRWMERTAPDGDGDPTIEAYLEYRRQRRAAWNARPAKPLGISQPPGSRDEKPDCAAKPNGGHKEAPLDDRSLFGQQRNDSLVFSGSALT